MKIEIELSDLKNLLTQQKRLTAEKLLDGTYSYNTESTESVTKSLPIDKNKFMTKAMCSKFPDDFEVLEKYLPKKLLTMIPIKVKSIIYIILSAIVFTGCDIKTEQDRLNNYIQSSQKPIVVRSTTTGTEAKPNLTLLSKDNKVLFLEYTSICLPDTIY